MTWWLRSAIHTFALDSDALRPQRQPKEAPTMIILDIALMVLISAAIVAFMTWSIFTQYRQPGCADLRIRRVFRAA
jgi:hypothetical protein